MHIAYVTDQEVPQTGTATRQTVNMAAAFGAAGARVTLIAPARWFRNDGTAAEDVAEYFEVAPNFELVTTRSAYPNIRGIEKLGHGIRGPLHPAALRADLVYTRMLPVVLGAIGVGRRVMYETYRPWPDQQPLSRPFFRWLARRSSFLGSVLHSHLAANSYLKSGTTPDKIFVAHNGYAPAVLRPRLSREDARRKCGLPTERPTVVYTGRVNVDKGLELVLEMAAERPEVLFIFVGSEGTGPIEQRADELENVRIRPWMSIGKTIPYLYAGDVLIIPPASGPLTQVGNTVLPMKTYLYMAAGRAILAPDTPDLRELLIDNVNSVLTEPDNLPGALARLDALMENSDRRASLGAEAKRSVSGLTWDRRAQRVLAFIQQRLRAAGI